MAILPLLILASGCHHGPSASSVKIGMGAQEVRTALGNPLITGAYRNSIPAMRKKIHEGMTRPQVQAAVGDPALGNNPKDPNPNPTWQYMDAVAPIDQMMVAFQGDKVSGITVIPNGAYGTQ